MRDGNKKRIALLLTAIMVFVNINSMVLATDYEAGNALEQELKEQDAMEEFGEDREEELLVENVAAEEEWKSGEELILDLAEETQGETAETETARTWTRAGENYVLAEEDHIGSIELTLAKNEYAEGVEAYFVSGAAITIKDQNGQVLENGTVKGDSYAISKMSAGKVKFWAQNDTGTAGMCAPLNRGEYHIGVTVSDTWYQTDAVLYINSVNP